MPCTVCGIPLYTPERKAGRCGACDVEAVGGIRLVPGYPTPMQRFRYLTWLALLVGRWGRSAFWPAASQLPPARVELDEHEALPPVSAPDLLESRRGGIQL